MRVNVYVRMYRTKKETRRLLIIRRQGQRDEFMNLGPVTQKEAEQRRIKVLSQVLNGTLPRKPLERVKLGEFCKMFLAEYLPGQVAESTVALYKDRLCQVCDFFGNRDLDEITRHDLELFLNGNEQWSGRSKNIILSCFKHLFRKAVEWNYLVVSPADGVRRWHEDSVGSRSLAQEELNKVMSIATPWQQSILIVLLYSGMRSGELSRFKFSDIDWENRKLHIVSDNDRKTKNRKSRVVDMTADLEKTLRFLWYNWPNSQYGSGGENIPRYLLRTEAQREYVICHQDGRPVGTFRRSFNRLMKEAGITGVTPHGIRKTFCSLLAKGKVHVKVAQKLMGHSDPRITLEIYTSVDDDQMREAVDTLPSFVTLPERRFSVIEGKKQICGSSVE